MGLYRRVQGPAVALSVALILLAVRPAAAQRSDRAALARRAAAALDALRYEDADRLYQELERAGGNDLEETRTIYRRLAEVAASMRQKQLAVSRYEKLLAIEPGFRPAAGSPDVFSQAVDLARRQPGALEPVAATAVVGAGREIGVQVSRDPLRLVAGAGAYQGGAEIARVTGGGTHRLVVPGDRASTVEILLIDEFGNQLVALPPIEIPAAARPEPEEVVAAARAPAPPAATGRPWYRRVSVWLGVSAVVVAGAGAGLGATVASRQDALDAILADSRDHRLSEAEEARDRLERRALEANLAFAAAGVLVTGAVIAFLLERDGGDPPRATVTASAGGDHALIGLGGSF